MHRSVYHFLVTGLAALTLVSSATAEDAQFGMPGDWLAQYQGAESAAMGGAFVASATGPLGSIWNPAGLSQMFQNTVEFESGRLFEGTSINGFGIAVPGSRLPSFGFTMLALRSGEFERTSELNEPLGSFDAGNTAFLFTLSKALNPRLSVGSNIKLVSQNLEEFSATGVGADLGFQFRFNQYIGLGASVLNIGGPSLTMRDAEETYLTEIRGGASVYLLKGRARFHAEIDRRSGLDLTAHAGSEFWLVPNMALRAGYESSGATGGLGYRMPNGFGLDYGVSGHDLGVTHRFAISYRFGGYYASSSASPNVFSPTGQNAVTKFSMQSKMKDDTAEWRMDIRNDSAEIVRSFGGRGTPPQQVLWDGKDATGLPLPDGVYRYRLWVRDVKGREVHSREHSVEILTSGPRGSVPVSVDSMQ
jgi:hypothetical protein